LIETVKSNFHRSAALIVFCVDRKGANTGDFGSLQGSEHGILPERFSDTLPMAAPIHRHSCKQPDRHWMAGWYLGQTLRSTRAGNLNARLRTSVLQVPKW
jgi:hypothetical protein